MRKRNPQLRRLGLRAPAAVTRQLPPRGSQCDETLKRDACRTSRLSKSTVSVHRLVYRITICLLRYGVSDMQFQERNSRNALIILRLSRLLSVRVQHKVRRPRPHPQPTPVWLSCLGAAHQTAQIPPRVAFIMTLKRTSTLIPSTSLTSRLSTSLAALLRLLPGPQSPQMLRSGTPPLPSASLT